MFALDVTGSMSDEIKQSKEIIKEISQCDRCEPVNYILTTFSDPVSKLRCLVWCALCCFVLCPFVLCFVALCLVVLCCVVLRYVALFYVSCYYVCDNFSVCIK